MPRLSHASGGGEGSNGDIIYPAVQSCRDSYAGMALWLDRLAATGASVSALVEGLPRYHRRAATVGFEHGGGAPLMQKLAGRWPEAQLDRRDGLKVGFTDGWIHARASNTEPLLRIEIGRAHV